MNSIRLGIDLFCLLHGKVFNSRLLEISNSLVMFVSDKCRVGITVIGTASDQYIPPEIKACVLSENVSVKYVFQPCSMDGVDLDSYYIFNHDAFCRRLDYYFWLETKDLRDYSWAACFMDLENNFLGLAAHMVRRELRQRALLADQPFRNFENTQIQLSGSQELLAKLPEELDSIKKDFSRWCASGFVDYPLEEQIDAHLTGILVRELVVSQRSWSWPIPDQHELVYKVVEIVKG